MLSPAVILHGEIWNAVQDFFEPIAYLDDGCVIIFDGAASQDFTEIHDAAPDAATASSDGDGKLNGGSNESITRNRRERARRKGGVIKERLGAKNLIAFYGPLNLSDTDSKTLIRRFKNYVPAAVLNWLGTKEMLWSDELRHVSVLFVNLGFDAETELANMHPGRESKTHARCSICYTGNCIVPLRGSLNKVLMDDKGSTLIAVFGLPPMAHEQDATRALLASLGLCARLYQMGKTASIGVTTGVAFCGVVGGNARREYSVLGDVVNLSARLMQRAQKEGGGVLCDASTKYRVRGGLVFARFGTIKVKGKKVPVKVFRPYPENLGHHGSNSNKWYSQSLGSKNNTAIPTGRNSADVGKSSLEQQNQDDVEDRSY